MAMAITTALQPHEFERPVLDLSGDMLRAALQSMVAGSEDHGGVERYVDAIKLKSQMFRQALVDNDVTDIQTLLAAQAQRPLTQRTVDFCPITPTEIWINFGKSLDHVAFPFCRSLE